MASSFAGEAILIETDFIEPKIIHSFYLLPKN